jgi:predicted methyltransferase
MKRILLAAGLLASCGSSSATQTETAHMNETQHHEMHEAKGTESAKHEPAHVHHFDNPEKFAKNWNSPERAEWQKPGEVIALMAITPGQTVADLGAGTGYFESYLSAATGPTGKVYALDVEDAMLTWIADSAKKDGLVNIETRKVAFDSTGLEPDTLDRLLTVNTWHHIENREAYAKHLFSVIKPGGSVIVVDFTKDAPEGPPAAMRLEPQVIIDELRAGGFSAELVTETLPRQYIVVGTRP